MDHALPRPFSVEHLCELPANLAKTELVVRPCVALLHSQDAQTGENADPEVSLIPTLDAREVAAVFTAPFADFLRVSSEDQDRGGWYRGSWSLWHNSNWRSRSSPFLIDMIDTWRRRGRSGRSGAAVKLETHLSGCLLFDRFLLFQIGRAHV